MSDRQGSQSGPTGGASGGGERPPYRSRFGGGPGGGGDREREGGDRERGRGPRRGGGGRYVPRRKVCMFCVDGIDEVDYKDIARLRRHIAERGKIEPRRKLGTCARHQRSLTTAIKRARHVALLPFTTASR
jgi:small subunit ribosomal protein S18